MLRPFGRLGVYKRLYLVEPEADYVIESVNGKSWAILGDKSVFQMNDDGFVDNMSDDDIPLRKLRLVNSCKGLVCLRSENRPWRKRYNHIIVCNPVTSDFVVVKELISTDDLHEIAGFGFSTKTNQYKVLRLLKMNKDDFFEAYVCTLGSDEEWRRLENRPPGESFNDMGIFFEGALYWINCTYDMDSRSHTRNIIAFDCQEENFSFIDVPVGFGVVINPNLYRNFELAILNSRLCFCFRITGCRTQYEIWVMNDNGVKDSWRKQFVIQDYVDYPLVYWNDGEILMISMLNQYSGLVSYDVKSNTLRDVKINRITGDYDIVRFGEVVLLDPVFIPTKTLLMQGI